MDKGANKGIDQDQCREREKALRLLWNESASVTRCTLVLAHGAGAPMDSPFLEHIAAGLAARGISVCRFEFEYMAARRTDGRKRPPSTGQRLLEEWRRVHAVVRQQTAGLLAVGGKSMGGRIASLIADELEVDGLVCLGYPFQSGGRPAAARTVHLAGLKTPTLIVQGTRDPFGKPADLAEQTFSPNLELHWLADADHDFKPLKRSGFTQAQHLDAAVAHCADFLGMLASR